MYRTLAWISLNFCLGTAVAHAGWERPIIILLGVCGVFWHLFGKWRIFFILFGISLVLGIAYEEANNHIHQLALQALTQTGQAGDVVAVGQIDGYIKTTPWGKEMPFLINDYLPVGAHRWIKAPRQSKVWLSVANAKAANFAAYSPLGKWRVSMRIKVPPPGPWADALKRKGIELVASTRINRMHSIPGGDFTDLFAWQGLLQTWVEDRAIRAYGALSGGFLLSFSIGDRTHLDAAYVKTFVAMGVVHAVVASGATIRMTVAPVVRWLTKRVSGRLPWLLAGGLLTFLMALLAGFAPPATRAALVYGYELIAFYLQKPQDFFTFNLFSLALMVLVEPAWLFDPGVIFAYAAATSIHILPGMVSGSLFAKIGNQKVRQLASKALALELGVTPFVAFEFGQFPYFSLLVSAFLYPLLEWVIPASFILLLLACVSPAGVQWLNLPLDRFFQPFANGLRALEQVPLNLQFAPPPVWVQFVYLMLMFFSVWQIRRYNLRQTRKYLDR